MDERLGWDGMGWGDGDDDGRVSIELIQPLDREIKENYTMSLIASDGGRPPLTGNTTIILTVLDANDHHPVFERVRTIWDPCFI